MRDEFMSVDRQVERDFVRAEARQTIATNVLVGQVREMLDASFGLMWVEKPNEDARLAFHRSMQAAIFTYVESQGLPKKGATPEVEAALRKMRARGGTREGGK